MIESPQRPSLAQMPKILVQIARKFQRNLFKKHQVEQSLKNKNLGAGLY